MDIACLTVVNSDFTRVNQKSDWFTSCSSKTVNRGSNDIIQKEQEQNPQKMIKNQDLFTQ